MADTNTKLGTIIGLNFDPNKQLIELFVRNNEGFKFRLPFYSTDIGYSKAYDFYMCSSVPPMTTKQFFDLPDRIDV